MPRAFGAQGSFGPMLAIGVDGYRKGWVAVRLADGRFDGALARPTLAEILQAWADAIVVGVDMPIHPPEDGPRARRHLVLIPRARRRLT